MQYSQNLEQYYVSSYFGQLAGCFLDIGANDGITLSNTYSLFRKGWAGTYVEASPEAFKRLVGNVLGSEDIEIFNFAIGSYDGEITLHESGELLGTGDVSLVSSTRTDEVHRWDSLAIPFKDVAVQVVTFESFLKKSKYNVFDLISVDIEGMEPEVIPQINFEELKCRMAIIEWNGKAGEFYDKIMLDHGMKCIHVNSENRIYCI